MVLSASKLVAVNVTSVSSPIQTSTSVTSTVGSGFTVISISSSAVVVHPSFVTSTRYVVVSVGLTINEFVVSPEISVASSFSSTANHLMLVPCEMSAVIVTAVPTQTSTSVAEISSTVGEPFTLSSTTFVVVQPLSLSVTTIW